MLFKMNRLYASSPLQSPVGSPHVRWHSPTDTPVNTPINSADFDPELARSTNASMHAAVADKLVRKPLWSPLSHEEEANESYSSNQLRPRIPMIPVTSSCNIVSATYWLRHSGKFARH